MDVGDPPPLPSGSCLGGGAYEILGVLGQGSFGITYLARDRNLDRMVAVKEHCPLGSLRRGAGLQLAPQPDLRRFLEEGRRLARFDHPGIVRVLAVFEENQTAYLAMDYLGGTTLAEVLDKGGPMPEPEAVELVRKLLPAFEALHGAGILHRDVKPSNIVLCEPERRPVLCDFGAAREYGGRARATAILTPGYGPPEQYGGSTPEGPFTDVYALAATLYEMVTGDLPPSAVERASGTPLSVSPGLSPRLATALRAGLSLETASRPGTVAEFLRLLEAPTPAVREPVVLAGHRGWVRSLDFDPSGQFLATGSEDKSCRVWRLSTREPVIVLDEFQDWVSAVRFSAQGVLATGSNDRLLALWNREFKPLARWQLPESVLSLDFSPPGDELIVGLWDGSVQRLTLASGRLEVLGSLPGPAWAVCWQPGGAASVTSGARRVFYLGSDAPEPAPELGPQSGLRALDRCSGGLVGGTEDGSLWSWREEGLHTLQLHAGRVWEVRGGPAGGRVASASADQTVGLWHPGAATGSTLQGHRGEVSCVAFSPDGQQLASGSQDETVRLWPC